MTHDAKCEVAAKASFFIGIAMAIAAPLLLSPFLSIAQMLGVGVLAFVAAIFFSIVFFSAAIGDEPEEEKSHG